MQCELCGGLVTWRGPLIALTHTQCESCGETNCQVAEGVDEREELVKERDISIAMLAAWCVSVDENGTGWGDGDEHYKDAAYRPGPLRELLDAAIATERAQRRPPRG